MGGYFDFGFPLFTSWRGELGFSLESRDRHPAADQATENRYGGAVSLKRHWTNTTFSLESKYNYLTGSGYVPNESNHLVSVLGLLSYGFY